jgi:hypothetical protein
MPSERLMIAAPLEPVSVGESFPRMPQHMTLLPWFDIDLERWQMLDRRLQEIKEEERFGKIVATERVMLGADESVPASRLVGVVLGAYVSLYGAVRVLGAEFDEAYMGANWTPHISDSAQSSLQPGESVVLRDMAVFRREIGGCSVKATYRLGSHEE